MFKVVVCGQTDISVLLREEALKRVVKAKNERPILVLTYNPALPSVAGIIRKHWKTLSFDKNMTDIFPKPPMVAYRQPANLRKMLIHAKLPTKAPKLTQRFQTGTKSCNKFCKICPYVTNTNTFKSHSTKETFKNNALYTCKTSGVIYLINCLKCGMQYVGESGRELYKRGREHIYNIENNKEAIGEHFNSKGHALHHLSIQIIEKVIPDTVNYRLERESMWIRKLERKKPRGLNIND